MVVEKAERKLGSMDGGTEQRFWRQEARATAMMGDVMYYFVALLPKV